MKKYLITLSVMLSCFMMVSVVRAEDAMYRDQGIQQKPPQQGMQGTPTKEQMMKMKQGEDFRKNDASGMPMQGDKMQYDNTQSDTQMMEGEKMENGRMMPPKVSGTMKKRDIPISITKARCDNVTKHLDKASGLFEKSHLMNMKRMEMVDTRLEKAISNLSEKGYDVTELEEALTTLKTLIAKLEADVQIVQEKVEASTQVQCGNSEGAFKTAMEDLRSAMQVVREDNKAIGKHLQEVVKPAMLKLKEQKVTITPQEEQQPPAGQVEPQPEDQEPVTQ